MTARVTQALVETLTRTTAPARVTQAAVEVLSATHAGARMTQALAEVLRREGTPVPRCEPLPEWIAYGATGGPEWGTALFSAPGGWEQRPQRWAQVRGRWDVSFLNVTREQAAILVDFFRAVAWGKAGSFCFTDWRDHTFANQIGVGDGVTSTYQLVKVYTSGTLSYTRPLTRTIESRLVVTINGVRTLDYTVDPTRGMLLFSSPPPTGAPIHAAGDFEVLVRFDTDQLSVTCVTPEVFSVAGLGLVELLGE